MGLKIVLKKFESIWSFNWEGETISIQKQPFSTTQKNGTVVVFKMHPLNINVGRLLMHVTTRRVLRYLIRVLVYLGESTSKPFPSKQAGATYYESSTASMKQKAWILALGSILAPSVEAFYLPGAVPHDYHSGERVELFVNALTPMIASANNSKLVSRSQSHLNRYSSDSST